MGILLWDSYITGSHFCGGFNQIIILQQWKFFLKYQVFMGIQQVKMTQMASVHNMAEVR